MACNIVEIPVAKLWKNDLQLSVKSTCKKQGNNMWTPDPSSLVQDAPELPPFRELFDQQDGVELSNLWRVLAGDWKIYSGQVEQANTGCFASAISTIEMENYIFEISLKWNHNHMGGLYGVYAGYVDSLNNLQVLLDVGKRQLIVYQIENGVRGNAFEISMENEFDFRVYHRLRIIKTGFTFKVYVDDLLKYKEHCCLKKASIGMVSHYTSAYFDGAEMTGRFELEEDNQNELLKYLQIESDDGNAKSMCWRIEKGSLQCVNPDLRIGNKVFLTGLFSESFNASVDTF